MIDPIGKHAVEPFAGRTHLMSFNIMTRTEKQIWDTIEYRGLVLRGAEQNSDVRAAIDLATKFFDLLKVSPTNSEFQFSGERKKTSKIKSLNALRQKIAAHNGSLLEMSLDRIHQGDHTKADAIYHISFSDTPSKFFQLVATGFANHFDKTSAVTIIEHAAAVQAFYYGFSHINAGLMDSMSYLMGLHVEIDANSEARCRFMQKMALDEGAKGPRVFLDIFDINILSSAHMETSVGGCPLDSFISSKGLGSIRRVGILNWLWTLDAHQIEAAKVEFTRNNLLAVSQVY